ncbi:MFS transporter [Liquorilactobacillus hordei]|uniref:MFS transporter n=1 Tax=Liquorilactobacillus hordei TaxID=468911 RepID=UPI0039EAD47E
MYKISQECDVVGTLSELSRELKTRLLGSFIIRLVGNMVYPFMALYFTAAWNMKVAGILTLVSSLISVVVSFFGGPLIDRYGHKRNILIAQGIQVFSMTVVAIINFSWWTSVTITALMLMLQNVGTGLLNPATESLLFNNTTKKNRKFVYSFDYWSTNISMGIGLMIGGSLYTEHKEFLFITLAVGEIIVWLIMFWGLATDIPITSKRKKNSFFIEEYRIVLQNTDFIKYCLAQLFVIFLEFQMMNYIAVRLTREFRWQLSGMTINGVSMASNLRVLNTILVIVLAWTINHFLSRYQTKNIFFLGMFMYILGYLILLVSNAPILLIFAIILVSLGELFIVPTEQTLLGILQDPVYSGTYMAIHGLVLKGAKILGSLGLILGSIVLTTEIAIIFGATALLGCYIFAKLLAKYPEALH